MPVIYTDEAGKGYDYGQLQSAYDSGAFGAGSRVPDILKMYAGSQTPAPTPAPNDAPPQSDAIRVPRLGTPVPVQTTGGGAVNPYDTNNAANFGSGGTFNVPSPGNDANQIYGWYSNYLGRPGSTQEVTDYLNSGKSLSQIQNELANSPDAQAFAARRDAAGNPAASMTAPTVSTKTPYDGSSQSLLLNAVLQRLSQLQKPIDTSNEDLFAKFALDRVNQLGGAPFTDTQNAALLTQHMQPLTQARDTAKQQAAVELSRRGFTPESGVFQDRMKQIDLAYQKGVANVTNTLNVQGIDQNTKNQQLQLQILSSLVDMGRSTRNEADQRSQQIVSTSALPFNTDLQTLSALTSASGGDNASSLISSLLNLGGLNLKGTEIQNSNDQANSDAIGKVVGYILNNHSAFGF